MVAVIREVAHDTFAGGRQQAAPFRFEVREGLGVASLGTGSTRGLEITLGRSVHHRLHLYPRTQKNTARRLITFEKLGFSNVSLSDYSDRIRRLYTCTSILFEQYEKVGATAWPAPESTKRSCSAPGMPSSPVVCHPVSRPCVQNSATRARRPPSFATCVNWTWQNPTRHR
ncbi:hypothetical protein D9M73_218570 [compost metagenome]